jgi:hypothetical protein
VRERERERGCHVRTNRDLFPYTALPGWLLLPKRSVLGTASFDTIQVNSSLSIDPKTRVTAALPSVLAVLSFRSR